jgi:ClpX C4-type zinc finger
MATDSLELNLTSSLLIPATDQALELHGTRCSFCGLGEGRVERLFEGRSRFICNECIRICSLLMTDYKDSGYMPPWHKTPWFLRWLQGDGVNAINCSFCGADRIKGEYLMASRHSQICERCIRACESLEIETKSRL